MTNEGLNSLTGMIAKKSDDERLQHDLSAAQARVKELEGTINQITRLIPLNYLQMHDTPGATSPTEHCNIVAALREYGEWKWRALDKIKELSGQAEAAEKRIKELEAELAQWQQWEDKTDELSEAIDAAHPMKTKTHGLYTKAHELVSNRHSKGALVGLVHYLIYKEGAAQERIKELENDYRIAQTYGCDRGYNEALEEAAKTYEGGSGPDTWDFFEEAVEAIRALKKEGE